MSFETYRLKDSDFAGKNIQSISETTVVGQAEKLKYLFDAPAQEVVRQKFNGLIDALLETTAGQEIGTPPLNANSGSTVAAQLAYLANQMAGAVLGQIPDGSITDAKLSASGIKQTVDSIQEEYALLESPVFTGTPTAPTKTFGDASQAIATTAFVANAIAPATTHMENTGIHVSQELKNNLWTKTNLYTGTAAPTGGTDGDIYFQIVG